jgi:protein-tyrosine phosphatase
MRMLLRFILAASLALLPPGLVAGPALAKLAASESITAAAEREDGRITLRWAGLTGPVQVYLLPNADAPARAGKLLTAANAESTVVDIPAGPRPYFLLRDKHGLEVRVAERLLPLVGGSNFRDLGGYRGAGGRTVRWGKIYRSAVMSGLTPSDFTTLSQLGIRTVCDFRANGERARDVVNWPARGAPKILTRDYELDIKPMMAVFAGGSAPTPEQARGAMAGFYRELPYQFAGQYKEMFAELLAGRAPLAFNCSAGKDRTGMAAVLILLALGVDREVAVTDFLLSNRYYKPAAPRPGERPDPTMAMFARLPPGVAQAFMGVDRSYIEAALTEIDKRGGVDRYFASELGLGPAERTRLQSLYLQG